MEDDFLKDYMIVYIEDEFANFFTSNEIVDEFNCMQSSSTSALLGIKIISSYICSTILIVDIFYNFLCMLCILFYLLNYYILLILTSLS
jgi:sensor histidine kinase YesM